MDLKILQMKGVETRIARVGPMPRLLANAAGVYSDFKVIELTHTAPDLIEDDSVADAMSTAAVFISTRWPSGKNNRPCGDQHGQVKNHRRLVAGLLKSGELCVRQFGAGYNIDAIHLISVYNALLTAVAMWVRDRACFELNSNKKYLDSRLDGIAMHAAWPCACAAAQKLPRAGAGATSHCLLPGAEAQPRQRRQGAP
jgi:hypothetical protein